MNFKPTTRVLIHLLINLPMCADAGRGERVNPSDPGHLQRSARLPRVLAHLQYHGRQPVRRKVSFMRRRRRQRH